MEHIPDDPIVAAYLRTGFPPWMQDESEADEPFAVYDPD